MRSAVTSAALVALVVGVTAAPAGAAVAPVGGANGGSGYTVLPKIKSVKCVRRCAKRHRVRDGSTIKLRGAHVTVIARITFAGAPGKADDVVAPVLKSAHRSAKLRVPAGATSGPLIAWTATGARARPSRPLQILPSPPVIGTPELTPLRGPQAAALGAGGIDTGTSTPRVVFFGAKHLVRFSLRTHRMGTPGVTVSLLRESDGATVQTWQVAAPDGQIVSVDWDGTVGGAPQPNGRYAFRITVNTTLGPVVMSSAVTDPDRDAFDLYGYEFPIRGPHTFSYGAGRFGAGRSGHTHQGQDTFAKCGTKLVAARGGTVRASTYQAAAGWYIVIDGDDTDVDTTYMHMVSRSPFSAGDHVYTGQKIGLVGDTGDAQGCHLHFEEWTGPGWYLGGHPFDPLPDLLAWDAYS